MSKINLSLKRAKKVFKNALKCDDTETLDWLLEMYSRVELEEGLPTKWEDKLAKLAIKSQEYWKADRAVARLRVLRDIYRDGWLPDWDSSDIKYSIRFAPYSIVKDEYECTPIFLAFPTANLRDQFLKNFKELIEDARPILGG